MNEILSNYAATRMIRCVAISPDLVLGMIKCQPNSDEIKQPIVRATKNAIPHDARLVNVRFTSDGFIRLIIEHESFAPVQSGHVIPNVCPEVSVEFPIPGDQS